MLNMKLSDQRLEYKSKIIVDFIMFKYCYEEENKDTFTF